MNALDGVQRVTNEKEEAVRHNTLSGPPINIRPNAVKIYLRRSVPRLPTRARARSFCHVRSTAGPSASSRSRVETQLIIRDTESKLISEKMDLNRFNKYKLCTRKLSLFVYFKRRHKLDFKFYLISLLFEVYGIEEKYPIYKLINKIL